MPRKTTSKRVSGSKKRKLHLDGSDEISLDRNVELCTESNFEVVNDSQTSLEGYRDLFGALIPHDKLVSNEEVKNQSIKKTPVTKKKKLLYDELLLDITPRRVFIPIPKFVKSMKEAQNELYSIMGARTSSSNVSIVSTDSLNISGVQYPKGSPRLKKIIFDDNDTKPEKVLEGVHVFIDYVLEDSRKSIKISFTRDLISLGAKVEKTFNRKVTHVLFCDGYRSTYKKTVERNIPLVSAWWLHNTKVGNKMQDPVDYPPVDMEKYTNPPIRNIIIPKRRKSLKKLLEPGHRERDAELVADIVKRVNAIQEQLDRQLDKSLGNKENCPIIDTAEKTTANKQNDLYKPNDTVNILSEEPCNELKKVVSPVLDEQIDELKDNDSRTMSINSMTIQTPDIFLEDDGVMLQSIACTGIIQSVVKILKSSINDLGNFIFHAQVKSTTTYLITKSLSNQSLDIAFAMAYGCYIVSEDWVHKSYSTGRWLSHQHYLIADLSEPVKEFQIRRHTTVGSSLKFNIFNNAGKIYISSSCESPAKLLRRLVHACGGHCTIKESNANVVVGNTLQLSNNISEKWIFDCITQGTLLNKYLYILDNSNE